VSRRGDGALAGLDTQSYHLAGNERFGEVITRSWLRLVGAWSASGMPWLRCPNVTSPLASLVTLALGPLLRARLWRLQPARGGIEADGASFPISHSWGWLPLHLVGAHVDLDKRTAGAAGAARSSPHSLVQELLNRDISRLWGIVSNGLRLRILRDNHSLTRQAYVEFDLEAMMDGEIYSDFVLLWLLVHQSRVEAEVPEDCWLERWSIEARTQGTRALDHLRNGVEQAILALALVPTALGQQPAPGCASRRVRPADRLITASCCVSFTVSCSCSWAEEPGPIPTPCCEPRTAASLRQVLLGTPDKRTC